MNEKNTWKNIVRLRRIDVYNLKKNKLNPKEILKMMT
jgi:hypothetical protein